MQRGLGKVFQSQGYRYLYLQPEGMVLYYKYYEQGFHVVMVVDMASEYSTRMEWQQLVRDRVTDLFYHPLGRLEDFPDGFPVYHVELLMLLVGDMVEQMRTICASCKNTWGYISDERRLLIYENQPGDFWGLKAALESLYIQDSREYGIKRLFQNKIRDIRGDSYIAISLVWVNILIFLVLELIGNTQDPIFIADHGGMYPDFIRYAGQWWRFLTAPFLHFGVLHLANNMVILYCVGVRLERAMGHWKMLTIYLLSAVGGCILSYSMMLWTGDYAVSAGASGAVYGTIGGLLWEVILRKGRFEDQTVRGLIFMLALSLYYGFSTMGIDNWGHIGGFVSGFVAAMILCCRKRQKD